MTQFRSDFLKVMKARGQLHQTTDETGLDALLQKERVAAYIGFDCTAPSLHVGSLVQIMTLRRLQQTGHKPIVLMGGGTTKVGDPSGKDEMRQLLTPEGIEANKKKILRVFERFLKFGEGPSDAIMADNAEWLDRLEYISFLRDIGRHFSVNRMLTMDSVKLRLERDAPLSFLEFNYMILDGKDRGRRGVAERGSMLPLRILAILAQHRGRGCGAFPAAVHRIARTGDRTSRDTSRRRAQ